MAHTFGGSFAEEPHWTLEDIAGVVDNPKLTSGEDGEQVLRAGCPAHDGKDRNCSFSHGADGKLLAHCFSHNCEFEKIVGALRERLNGGARNIVSKVNGTRKNKKKRQPIGQTVWEIENQFGDVVAEHVRTDYDDGTKKVAWRMPDGTWNLRGAGLTPADIPLYGIAEAIQASPEMPIVITEGEKAADAVLAAGIPAVGTVTGATGTPGEVALRALTGHKVIVWPDNDTSGHKHMGRVAEALKDLGVDVLWFNWDEAPEKGDAADFLEAHDAQKMRLDLKERSEPWSEPPVIDGLIRDFGTLMRRGIKDPEELLADILLMGKAHSIFGAGGIGKTWVMVWMAKELCEAGKRVVIFDGENGLRTYMSRFEKAGADKDKLNENFVYGPFVSFDPESYEKMLDKEKPDVVMFDSWIGFLAADSRDENTANDIALWARDYSKPALSRGIAIVVLDHVGHEHAERERGARRKRDEMDVVWKLKRDEGFNRERGGSLEMYLEKDREGWLPEHVGWSVGGSDFRMEREDQLASALTKEFLSGKEGVVLDALTEHGPIKAGALLKTIKSEGVTERTLYRILRKLEEAGKVENINQEWRIYEGETEMGFEA